MIGLALDYAAARMPFGEAEHHVISAELAEVEQDLAARCAAKGGIELLTELPIRRQRRGGAVMTRIDARHHVWQLATRPQA